MLRSYQVVVLSLRLGLVSVQLSILRRTIRLLLPGQEEHRLPGRSHLLIVVWFALCLLMLKVLVVAAHVLVSVAPLLHMLSAHTALLASDWRYL